jgi:hypothetical protein
MGASRERHIRYVGDQDIVRGYGFFFESKLRVSCQVDLFTSNLLRSKRSLERYCQSKGMRRRTNPSSALVRSVEIDEAIQKYFWASKPDPSILRYLQKDHNAVFSYLYLLPYLLTLSVYTNYATYEKF